MVYAAAFLLGLLPFAAGGLMNWFMLSHPDTLPPLLPIALGALIAWGLIAFLLRRRAGNGKALLLCLNLPALAVLILLGIQELVLHAYWPNAAGHWTQFFYLPLLHLSFRLMPWFHRLFPDYCFSFLLLAAASAIGSALRRKK